MSDDLVKRLHSFDCITMDGCGGELRQEAADRIEELEAEIKLHEECATIVHFQGVMYARDNMADAVWAEFKDRWEGERKYALRQIVRYLKNTPGGEAEGQ